MWQRYDGALHIVVGECCIEPTGELAVLYQRFVVTPTFRLPLAEWHEPMELENGSFIPRYARRG